jgi:peptide/nickel transport system substrate-binding protein
VCSPAPGIAGKPPLTNMTWQRTRPFHRGAKGEVANSLTFSSAPSYHCKGQASTTCDKTTDELIEKAQLATGEERKNVWRAIFKRVYEEVVPDVMLFHMVGYCRVGKRINYKPSMATVNEIQLSQITFK